ncbi:MAG: YraN family protein [Gammaproteobacteria bacterium]|nr:YraN family protein [Gammaproteobacteria bacterium]
MVRLYRFIKRWFVFPAVWGDVLGVDEKGWLAEKQAAQFLQKQGLSLLTHRFRVKQGEVDLIMQEGAVLVFVEVRFRAAGGVGASKESIGYAKQRKIIYAAHRYLQKNKLKQSAVCRFDVVAMSGCLTHPEIEWVKNAFVCRQAI